MDEALHDDWNPRDASILEEQHRAYDDMREQCLVAHSEFMGWSLFLHEDVAVVLADPAIYSNVSRFLAIPNGMNPPDHGRYRDALVPNFDHEQMAKLEPRARNRRETSGTTVRRWRDGVYRGLRHASCGSFDAQAAVRA